MSVTDREILLDNIYNSLAVEFSAASDGKPVTFPLSPFWDSDTESLVVSSPPAFAGKVEKAKENPDVSALFYDDEPLRIRGKATVRENDPWANGEYVSELIEKQRDTPKKRAFQSTDSFMNSWLGSLFFDWYALRVVVEVDVSSVERLEEVGEPATPRAWSSVGMDSAEARRYDRVVLAVTDDEGCPVSAPVTGFRIDDDEAVLDADLPVAVEEGQPGCLLFHWHSRDLSDIGQRLVRGRCHPDGDRDSLRFEAGSSFALRNETALDALRFIVNGKRRTRAYFDDGPLTWRW